MKGIGSNDTKNVAYILNIRLLAGKYLLFLSTRLVRIGHCVVAT